MLYEAKNAYWARRLGALGWRYTFFVGKKQLGAAVSKARWHALEASQRIAPTPILSLDGRRYWWFEGEFNWENKNLTEADVLALVRQHERRDRQKLTTPTQRCRSIASHVVGASRSRARPASRSLTATVDAAFSATRNLTFSSTTFIPVSMGGATSVENLQLLCAPCNQAKAGALRLM